LSTATPHNSPDAGADPWIDLTNYRAPNYQGRGVLVRTIWYFVSLLLFESGWFLLSGPKRAILRMFGAQIGQNVSIKPHVQIKFPWKLVVGDHSWIGEGSWIDNLAEVRIGSHVCISQGVYFCTGSHDHNSRGFELITRPIEVGNGAWIATRSTLLPGITVGANAIVAAGSVVHKDVPAATMVGGAPAKHLGAREFSNPQPSAEV